jgi:hypothetical protein
MVQIKGKILTAKSKNSVGATKIHAMVRSDKLRIRRATPTGVPCATLSKGEVFMSAYPFWLAINCARFGLFLNF